MAKSRYITTDLWRDSYIDSLNPSEKLLWIYLICNPSTNLSGIYQCPERIMASDTGFEVTMVHKIFKRFQAEKKAYYIDGWVILPNAPKHQNLDNPKICKGIERELREISDKVLVSIDKLSIPYVYPIDKISHLTKPNLTKLKKEVSKKETSPSSKESITEVNTTEDGDEIGVKVSRGKITPQTKKINDVFRELCQKHIGQVSPLQLGKQGAIIKKALVTLSEEQIYDVFDWWFNDPPQGKQDHDLIQITQALSAYNITRYQTEYGNN